MAGLDEAEIDWLARSALDALERDEALPPAAVVLLLRRYLSTGDERLAGPIGAALARALDAFDAAHLAPDDSARADRWRRAGSRAEWLLAFLTGASLSDDERLRDAAGTLADTLRRDWPLTGDVGPALVAVEACLRAATVLGGRTSLVQAAIDELERVVGMVYEPGAGISRTIGHSDAARAQLMDVVAAASTLLTAYEMTARLPYAMLAEELVQFSRRTWWNDAHGWFAERPPTGADRAVFLANSEAARVLQRMAALHEEADYRAHAVIAPEAGYRQLAERVLSALRPCSREHGLAASVYGLALIESA
jgi:hypothetical protein